MAKDIQWEALESEYREKSVDWYWAVGIITITLVIGAVLLDNFLFALLILLASITLVMYAVQKPKQRTFRITPRGIHIDDTLYPYQTLESFWVADDERGTRLLVQSEKIMMPYIVIPLPEQEVNPERVREFLLAHLDEEHHQEPFSQQLMRMLGF